MLASLAIMDNQKTIRLGLDASMLETRRTGVGNYVFNLLNELRTVAPEIVLYLYSDRVVADDCRHFGLIRECLGPPIKKGPLWMSMGLGKILEQDGIDIFWGGNGYLPLRLPKRIRSVVTVHDLVYKYSGNTVPWISRWSRRILQPIASSSAHCLIAVSISTAHQIQQTYGRKVDLIMHPRIDPIFGKPLERSDIDRVRQKYNLPATYYFTLGTLEPRKNLINLLEAYSILKSDGVSLPPLLMAGNRGWLENDILSKVDELSANGSVRWLGFVDQSDMPILFNQSSLFIFVPVYEGFGMPVREALLSNARVLASNIESVREAAGGSAAYTNHTREDIESSLRSISIGKLELPSPSSFSLTMNEIGTVEAFASLLRNLLNKVQ